MTNQQLIVLLRSFRKRLSTEIARIHTALPEGSERTEQTVYTGDGQPGKFSTPATDPRHWAVQKTGEYVVLAGLAELLAELDEATAILSAGERPQPSAGLPK